MAETLKIARLGADLFALSSGSPSQGVSGNGTRRWELDDTVTEEIVSQPFEWPSFTGVPNVAVWGTYVATSGNIGWKVAVEAVTSGDAINVTTTSSFDSDNSSGAVAVPGTAGHTNRTLVPLTNPDSVAAGDRVRLRISSDLSVSSKATGNRYFEFASLVDVT